VIPLATADVLDEGFGLKPRGGSRGFLFYKKYFFRPPLQFLIDFSKGAG